MGDRNLQGTVFEREFTPLLKELAGKGVGKTAAGSYSLFLIWHEALKLKLKADWIEPAHFRDILEEVIVARSGKQLVPGIREPAHFRRLAELLDREDALRLVAELTEVLKKYGL
ncbi:hypothetical protein [Geobacter pickeringii]|uniref:Uncharacterized protein n=1 Tax=Geobacter pickeringii TaxID=345632 RepID=A0A0B5BDN1_9BACT|nr:hypothetical protein [Geobacter pickeringii]AJE02640.1 hypothetical protein GPICK_03975 [Geobacter pickeringii]